jgi:hypothetical protein
MWWMYRSVLMLVPKKANSCNVYQKISNFATRILFALQEEMFGVSEILFSGR